MQIEYCDEEDIEDWLAMRCALWPDQDPEGLRAELPGMLADLVRWGCFMARDSEGKAIGLAEVSIRSEHVNGASTCPLAFLEAVYVAPRMRRRSIGAALVARTRQWAMDRGCRELASDAQLDNQSAHDFHRGAGFAETMRVVYFISKIGYGQSGRSAP